MTKEKIRDELLERADELFPGTSLDDVWSEQMSQVAMQFIDTNAYLAMDKEDFPEAVAGVLEAFIVYLASRVYDTSWILERLQGR